VSPAGALNFNMLANLHGGMAGGLAQVAAAGSGKGGIPFKIEGTTADPKFIPDVGGMAGSLAAGAAQQAISGKVPQVPGVPTNSLGGLLGGKKK